MAGGFSGAAARSPDMMSLQQKVQILRDQFKLPEGESSMSEAVDKASHELGVGMDDAHKTIMQKADACLQALGVMTADGPEGGNAAYNGGFQNYAQSSQDNAQSPQKNYVQSPQSYNGAPQNYVQRPQNYEQRPDGNFVQNYEGRGGRPGYGQYGAFERARERSMRPDRYDD